MTHLENEFKGFLRSGGSLRNLTRVAADVVDVTRAEKNRSGRKCPAGPPAPRRERTKNLTTEGVLLDH